jgi:hypothetical protein
MVEVMEELCRHSSPFPQALLSTYSWGLVEASMEEELVVIQIVALVEGELQIYELCLVISQQEY